MLAGFRVGAGLAQRPHVALQAPPGCDTATPALLTVGQSLFAEGPSAIADGLPAILEVVDDEAQCALHLIAKRIHRVVRCHLISGESVGSSTCSRALGIAGRRSPSASSG